MRLEPDRVVPWRPERLAVDPGPSSGSRGTGGATRRRHRCGTRRGRWPRAPGELVAPRAPRSGWSASPRVAEARVCLDRGPVLLGPRRRPPPGRRPAGDRVRPDARAGARGRGRRRSASATTSSRPISSTSPAGRGSRPRCGRSGATWWRALPGAQRLASARARPPRLAAHRAGRAPLALRRRPRARAALRARRARPLQVHQRHLRGQTLTSGHFPRVAGVAPGQLSAGQSLTPRPCRGGASGRWASGRRRRAPASPRRRRRSDRTGAPGGGGAPGRPRPR